MKSSKLAPAARAERRELIMEKRKMTISMHNARGRSFVQSKTTRFDVTCNKRQRARYARQIAAGQIRLEQVAPAAPVKPKRAPRAKKTAA